MLSHEELEAFAGAPELVDTRDELLQLIRHVRECTECARTFKTALDLEETQLMPLRAEWRHLGDRELRRLREQRYETNKSNCETPEALHLAFCADCAERYRHVPQSRSFFFRPVVATAAISAVLVAGGLTWFMKHGSEGSPTAYRSAPTLGLSAPDNGGSLAVWDSFRWQPIAGASVYELSIYDAETDAVVLRRTTVTPVYVLQPEDATVFVSGNAYVWQVKGESATAGTLTSARRRFRFSTTPTPQADAPPSYRDFPDDRRKAIAAQVRKGDEKIRRSTLQELQSYATQNHAETTPDMAWALSEMALITYYLEERDRCEEYYRKSLATWKMLNTYPFVYAKTLSNYGLALQDDGKFGEARQAYLEAATILRTEDTSASRVVLSNTMLNLGTLLRKMGLYNEALNAQMETVDLDTKSDRPDRTIAVAQDFTDIGNTYADLQDLSTALQYLNRAYGEYMGELQLRKKQRRSFADLCEVYQALADDLGSLGDAYAADGNSKEAILRYSQTQSADKRCHSEPHQMAQTLNNIGELFVRHLNQPSSAQHYYERALPLVEKRSIDEAWRTYYGLGLVAFHTGRDADAETWFDKAIQAVETVTSSSPDVESQRHVWSNRTAPFYALALLQERRGSAAAALQAIELGRHRSLSETGLGKIAANSYQWDPHTTESGTVGLEYFFGEADDPLLVVVVSRDGIQAHELGNGRKIEELVTAANKALAVPSGVPELENQFVELAYRLLPPEVLTGLQNGSIVRLLVSPDGALTQFPISALAIPERSGQHYLLDRADVTMVPSLGWWFKERHGTTTWPANDALVVADPIVDEVNGCAVPVNLLADLRSSTQTFPRLSFTAREAESVTRYASRDSLLLSAERATERMLLSSSPFNFKILHFATHAHAGDDLWSSFIVLRCRGQLDALAGREIPSLKLNGQLVVLSACGGSAGRSLSGMGSDSIASGFLMGGASAVVASHWPVEDKSTAQLMEAFYQELGNGTRVDHALRAAQLRLASSAPNSPRLWAAFEVIGDGDLIVPIQATLRVRSTTFSRRHWLVLLLTVIALGGIAGARMWL